MTRDTLLLQFWNKVDVFNLLMFLLAGWFQYQVMGQGRSVLPWACDV